VVAVVVVFVVVVVVVAQLSGWLEVVVAVTWQRASNNTDHSSSKEWREWKRNGILMDTTLVNFVPLAVDRVFGRSPHVVLDGKKWRLGKMEDSWERARAARPSSNIHISIRTYKYHESWRGRPFIGFGEPRSCPEPRKSDAINMWLLDHGHKSETRRFPPSFTLLTFSRQS
jgi:hypothetical protein